jgi:hypothetical protein
LQVLSMADDVKLSRCGARQGEDDYIINTHPFYSEIFSTASICTFHLLFSLLGILASRRPIEEACSHGRSQTLSFSFVCCFPLVCVSTQDIDLEYLRGRGVMTLSNQGHSLSEWRPILAAQSAKFQSQESDQVGYW